MLKEYLVKGYAVNERIRKEQIGELRQLVGKDTKGLSPVLLAASMKDILPRTQRVCPAVSSKLLVYCKKILKSDT